MAGENWTTIHIHRNVALELRRCVYLAKTNEPSLTMTEFITKLLDMYKATIQENAEVR